MSDTQTIPLEVMAVFQRHAPEHRAALFEARALILDVADKDPRIGPLEEALRWGEPAYITKAKTGSTIRLGIEKKSGRPALFFNCNTTLVEEFRQQFGDVLGFSKNRAILIGAETFPKDAIQLCIASALTYHIRKKRA